MGKRNRAVTSFLIGAAAAAAIAAGAGAWTWTPVTPAWGSDTTLEARSELEDALALQKAAIARFRSLLQRDAGTHKEPATLTRFLDSLAQISVLEFQIAHQKKAPSKKGGPSVSLASFYARQKQIIDTAGVLITKFTGKTLPQLQMLIPHAHFLRAKALKELDMRMMARKDLETITTTYPKSAEAPISAFILSDLMMEQKEYPDAIQLLSRFSGALGPGYYPLLLDRYGWCFHYLKDQVKALENFEKEIVYYRNPANHSETSDGELKNALEAAALVIVTGIEQKQPGFDIPRSLAFFQRHASNGEHFKLSAKALGFLLASKGLEPEFEALVRSVLANNSPTVTSTSVAGELLSVALEHQLNKRLYPSLKWTLLQVGERLPKSASDNPKNEKLLSQIAAHLQAKLNDEKKAAKTAQATDTAEMLVSVYQLLIRLAGNDLRKLVPYSYNLAETEALLKYYESATAHYRWVAKYAGATQKFAKLTQEAHIRAISARFEVIKSKSLVVKQLAVKKLSEKPSAALDPSVSEWVQWIDRFLEKTKAGPIEFFAFEANRILYNLGFVDMAIERLAAGVRANPNSPNAVAAVSLILDTCMTSEQWERAHRLALEFAALRVGRDSDFPKQLAAVQADSLFKSVEADLQSKNYAAVSQRIDLYLKNSARNNRTNDLLALAANASLAAGNKAAALGYFHRMDQDSLKPEQLSTAFLTEAALAEDKYDFEAAARSYRSYLHAQKGTQSEEISAIRKKTLLFAWLSGKQEVLSAAAQNHEVCVGQVALCERYRLLSMLMGPAPGFPAKTYSTNVKKASQETRVLWLALALKTPGEFGIKELSSFLRNSLTEWEKQDTNLKYALLPHFSTSIPAALEQVRAKMRKASPLKVSKAVIDKRIALLKKFEDLAAELSEAPWVRLRVAALYQVAQIYFDFSHDLRAIRPPKGIAKEEAASFRQSLVDMSLPFEGKAKTFLGKAFTLGSTQPIEDDLFESLQSDYFSNQSDEAHTFGNIEAARKLRPVPIHSSLVKLASASDGNSAFNASWTASFNDGNFPRISFLIQEAKLKKILPDDRLTIATAVALAKAGAQAEALATLETGKKEFEPSLRNPVTASLLAHHFHALNRDATRRLAEEYASHYAPENGSLLAQAAQWSSADISSSIREQLAKFLNDDGRKPAGGEEK